MRIRPLKAIQQPLDRHQGMHVLAILCLALGVSVTACVAPAANPAQSNTQTPVAAQTPPQSFVEVPEMTFAAPGRPLPDGPVSGLTGLYGEFGTPVLSTCRIEESRLLCNRYPVELEAVGPKVIEVSGQVSGGKLSVDSWKPVVWDQPSQLAVAEAHLDRLAPDLAGYDWSQIARPDFAESSSRYHPSEEEIRALSIELAGYDATSNRIVWRAQGPDLPQQKPLVRRFSALYIVTDPAGKMPSDMFVTIEGYVEE